ncbi:MAG TPA: phosphomethylpyrimidine synthase ThiC [Clostridia bacterium]|nr:phosphomethylpyrimidine synthase ThiC [Clostridia bacterium]
MTYTTQMDAAKKKIVTQEMEIVAKKENIEVATLLKNIAEGKVVIPANKNHKALDPEGIGLGLRTKINVNLGVSQDCLSIEPELKKAEKAMAMKTEAIMDLSSFGRTEEFRKRLIEMSTVMIGTVPVYDAVAFYDKDISKITAEEFLQVVKKHAEDGVDFMTIHAGINRENAEVYKRSDRLLGIVSRGGSLLYAWMEATGKENPFYEYYDDVLDICEKYDVTISLGDALRPGSIKDSTDASQIKELITLGELAKRAKARNVQVIIEGPGHMRINEIAANVLLEKKLCEGAPFYVLGPVVTDVAPGYDHITSAIGGAIAAANGADFLCYVTPAEHLRLPTLDDMKEGIIAAKIAAHAADLAKGVKNAEKWDYEMGEARSRLDWDKMFQLAMAPEKARRYREESLPQHKETCTMCGEICAVRTMQRLKEKEEQLR